jgi:hypothetical protein
MEAGPRDRAPEDPVREDAAQEADPDQAPVKDEPGVLVSDGPDRIPHSRDPGGDGSSGALPVLDTLDTLAASEALDVPDFVDGSDPSAPLDPLDSLERLDPLDSLESLDPLDPLGGLNELDELGDTLPSDPDGAASFRELRPQGRLRIWQLAPIVGLAATGSLMFAFPLAFEFGDGGAMVAMLGLLISCCAAGWAMMAGRRAGYIWPGLPARDSGRRPDWRVVLAYTAVVAALAFLAVWRVTRLR